MSTPFPKKSTGELLAPFLELDQRAKYQCEYIWIDAGQGIRAKTRTLNHKPERPQDIPLWNFDGSSTGDADGHDSEVYLRAVRIFRDPFRKGENIMALCECLSPTLTPIASNSRAAAEEFFGKVQEQVPWFGIEQEYTLFEENGRNPLGWPQNGYPAPQGPYYCGVGTGRANGRDIVEAHYRACLYAGINISGINAEVMPAQWEFQVGPCEGIEAGDHVWMGRFLLTRVCELFGVVVSLDPKPIPGDWNGAGCHTNFSTKEMRSPGGYEKIIEAVKNLETKHDFHMSVYGEGNTRRMTGAHETEGYGNFSYGVANRGASIRIPRDTERDGFGYFEDRRPASNMDPYVVTPLVCATSLGMEYEEHASMKGRHERKKSRMVVSY